MIGVCRRRDVREEEVEEELGVNFWINNVSVVPIIFMNVIRYPDFSLSLIFELSRNTLFHFVDDHSVN